MKDTSNSNLVWRIIWISSFIVVLLLLGVYCLIPTDAATGNQNSFLTEGFRVMQRLDNRGLYEDSGGIQAGDLILSIDGKTFTEAANQPYNNPLPKTLTYEINRSGTSFSLEVMIKPVYLQELLPLRLWSLIAVLGFIILGTLLTSRLDKKSNSYLFLALSVSGSLFIITSIFGFQPSMLLQGWTYYIHLAVNTLSYTMMFAILLHITLIFPEKVRLVKKYPVPVLTLIYGAAPLAVLVIFLTVPGFLQKNITSNLVKTSTAYLQMATSAGLILHNIINTKSPMARAQIRWMLFGLFFTALFAALRFIFIYGFHNDADISYSYLIIPDEVFALLLLVLPITLAAFIQRRHLPTVDYIVSRGLFYTLSLLTLGAIYVIATYLLKLISNAFLSGISEMQVYLIGALIILILFFLMQNRGQRWVNKIFFRTKLDYEKLAPEFHTSLIASIDLEQLTHLMNKELPRRFQIEWAFLLWLDQEGQQFRHYGERFTIGIPAGHPLSVHLYHTHRPILLYVDEPQLPDDVNDFLKQHHIRLSIPLIVENQLIGIYNLGAKKSGLPYTLEEAEILASLKQSAAIALNNARKYQKIGDYTQEIEEEVKQRTLELEQAVNESHTDRFYAQKASQTQRVFINNISHEIRTPMNAIIDMTESLYNSPLTPKQEEYIKIIRNNSSVLLNILNEIIDYSFLETGKVSLDIQPFRLLDCIESVLNLVAAQAAQKGIQTRLIVGAMTPIEIKSDCERLHQILLNLLENAVKFTDKGTITIHVDAQQAEAPPIYKHVAGKQNVFELKFNIADTGTGIPEDMKESIFKSFSQIDSSKHWKTNGTGLGLTISKRLSEIMGGNIWVESPGIPGKGSVFSFTILAEAGDNTYPACLSVDQPQLRGKKVLIIEDEQSAQKSLSLQLESWGMQPMLEADASIAIKRVQEQSFDLVLAKMDLPGLTGNTIAKEIHLRQPDLPVILMTKRQERYTTADTKNARAVVQQPVKTDTLYNTLAHIFAKTFEVDTHRQEDQQIEPQQHAPKFLHVQNPVSQSETPGFGSMTNDNSPNNRLNQVLDMEILDDLLEGLDRDGDNLLKEVVDGFFSDADKLLQQNRTAVDKKAFETIVRSSHMLKSNSAALGASMLASAARDLEVGAMNKEDDKLADLLTAVEIEYNKVKAALRYASRDDE